jgi:hypothetical protein
MVYLWRHFLESQKLPTVIFQQNLKLLLTQKLYENYKEDTEMFIGVSSRFMPAIRTFMYFWETTVSYEEYGEYEIDELCTIYQQWLSASISNNLTTAVDRGSRLIENTKDREVPLPASSLTEKQMLDLIGYYYPNTGIEKDKYVYNIRCSLWDKQMDIQTALSQMKEELRAKLSETENPQIYATTVYDAYIWYCKYRSDAVNVPSESDTSTMNVSKPRNGDDRRNPIVSKLYFEKYVANVLYDYVVEDKYILREWAYSDLV